MTGIQCSSVGVHHVYSPFSYPFLLDVAMHDMWYRMPDCRVLRNPGLLGVRASEAAKASDQTMVFSYIVAATRPIGIAGPIVILSLVMVPVFEGITGVPIRGPFLAALGIDA